MYELHGGVCRCELWVWNWCVGFVSERGGPCWTVHVYVNVCLWWCAMVWSGVCVGAGRIVVVVVDAGVVGVAVCVGGVVCG